MTLNLPILKEKKGQALRNENKSISSDDMDILNTLDLLERELELAHKNLDYLTDSSLIDGCIYEIKALHMKYKYYLNICKERGLIATGFNKIS